MKNLKYIAVTILLFSILSCSKDFLDKKPQGELTEEQLTSQDGVEGLLIGTYGLLNGNIDGTWGNYAAGPSQWLLGEVTSDNAHKGSSNGDQPEMNALEQHAPTGVNDNLENLWNRCFEGIQRANNTLKILASLQAGNGGTKFGAEREKEIQAEARLLRAHYYFFLVRAFKDVPYISETTTTPTVPNDKDIYPEIQADLEFAVANLGTAKPKGEIGRMDKYSAQAYLGKVLLYQKKFPEAYAQLNAVILAKPALNTLAFTDNFDITRENGPESIVTVQHSVGTDGTGGDNGNVGDMLNFPYGNGLPIACCGFFQPSIDLASAYKVDANGLPLLDGSYRTNPYKSDFGLTAAQKAAYKVDQTLALDPRIDYTMGRRGVPFRDWGIMTGDSWIRDASNGGPFVNYKNTIEAAQIASGTGPGNTNITGLNVNLIRLADVYLMAAECAVETGDLGRAMTLVNAVRARAALLPGKTIGGAPAANYKVGQYTSFPNPTYARNAVRFERRLELAMEGHRFYDLVRWGIAKETLESYFGFEGGYFNYLKGLTIEARDTYFPIPQQQIDRSGGVLKQSTGY
ncbi:RagB/SusD family nutrient uptake outer membrane protein [Pedobacter antarcticus]|uniref:RagB/SusD family nutrient uptake outer membrane protein n=1 Tax=Pedobacter antarcticus TaxID=34086 RepID=UPI00088E147D|nr:RagB/SusD family nutrient uptake outer membrane protein [Pedobacter antarcticus]SDM56038.1 Starch-binding associating with outer membrane [Pedobacter antarcticus]